MSEKSKVEELKLQSQLLRGTLAESLKSNSDQFTDDELQLIKFHGMYQQDDRDLRGERRKAGLDKAYSLMIRCNIPAGLLSSQQYLGLDNIADKFANGSLRITTRQSIQFHGVLKQEIKQTIAEINTQLITTLAACGDVQRNVMASIAPIDRPIYHQIKAVAKEVTRELLPKTNAYHEIWLDGEKVTEDVPEIEDFYGNAYLPRKFKTGITIAGENGIDVYSYDAGLIAIPDSKGDLDGFNVLAGGGLGMSHGRENTFAQLAYELGFVAPENGVEALKVIGSIYRDFGNREDRKQARLKYLIAEKGAEWFVEEFRRRAPFELQLSKNFDLPIQYDDFLGPRDQGNGLISYGIFVQNGRIVDAENCRMRTAIRTLIERFNPGIVLTPQQSILLTNLSPESIPEVEKVLQAHGVDLADGMSGIRRYSMACPAMPTCGLAVAESERAITQVLAQFESLLQTFGLEDEPIGFRMTGCPNGCARPYTADIALVGRRPGIYHLFVGGRLAGDTLADLFAGDVKIEEVVEVLRPLIKQWATDRVGDEGLGEFYQRVHRNTEKKRRQLTGKETPTLPLIQLGAIEA